MNQVLKRLPQKEGDHTSASDKSDSGSQWVATFETYLQECRVQETQPMRKPNKKKLNVPAGKGVDLVSMGELIKEQEKHKKRKEMKRNNKKSAKMTS